MYTYQTQPRVLKVETDEPLSFPTEVEIRVFFQPAALFGGHRGPLPNPCRAKGVAFIYNANNGRAHFEYQEPLPVLDVRGELGSDGHIHLLGNELIYRCRCENRKELGARLQGLLYVLPTILHLSLPGPPVVERIGGRIGNRWFRWEIRESRYDLHPFDMGEVEAKVAESLGWFDFFSSGRNRRPLAALQYVHRASRLINAGASPWEFFGEAILNFAKSIEILFGSGDDSRDKAREGLRSLGYKDDEVEGIFIPVVFLRNSLDVGHGKVSTPRASQAARLFSVLPFVERQFKDLCHRVLGALREGEKRWERPSTPDPSREQELEEYIRSLEGACPRPPLP